MSTGADHLGYPQLFDFKRMAALELVAGYFQIPCRVSLHLITEYGVLCD